MVQKLLLFPLNMLNKFEIKMITMIKLQWNAEIRTFESQIFAKIQTFLYPIPRQTHATSTLVTGHLARALFLDHGDHKVKKY